ncbi:MAG TPA: tetratricopeptide repeat protein [Pirellulales bacterium]|nr:tetratricopeptide repeat protein [Pirellulales bacterium]
MGLLLAGFLSAKADDKVDESGGSLVGKKVIAIRPDVVLRLEPADEAKRVDFTPSCYAVEVEAEQGEWLKCDCFWLRRSDAVRLSEAIAYFTQQIERSPTAYAYVARSRAWVMDKQDSERALADAEAAIRLDPKFALAWMSRGECRFHCELYADAIPDFAHALELDPRLYLARLGLVYAHRKVKDFDGAIADCTAGLMWWSNDSDLLKFRAMMCFFLGERHESQKRPDLAEQDYTHAIEDMRAAIAELAATGRIRQPVSREDGDYKRKSAARLLGGFYAYRGFIRASARRYEAAIADCNEAIRLRPDEALAYVSRGVSLFKQGKQPEAIRDLEAAVRLEPKLGELRAKLGEAIAILGDYPQAIQHFTQAIKLDPRDADLYWLRALAWELSGEPAKAIEDLTSAIALDPENPEFYRERAETWRSMWKFLKARRDFAEAERLEVKQTANRNEENIER